MLRTLLSGITGAGRLFEACCSMCWHSVCRLRKPGKRDKKKGAVLAIISIILMYYIYSTVTMPVRFLFTNKNVNSQCIIPDLDPFDKSIMKYVWSPDPISCDPNPDLVYVDNNGMVRFNTTAMRVYASTSYTCSYMTLNRKPDNDYTVFFSKEVAFEPPVQIKSEFFRVRCRNIDNNVVYDRLLESVYSEPVLRKYHITPESRDDNKFSVFMFGIDSTSRLSAIRKLPKTFKYIKNELDAIVFKGYMKYGDNTFPNIVPVLTGKRPWTKDLPGDSYKHTSVDHFPFIWKNFSEANYVTFYAEDYPDIATFNTEASGFVHPPTHHYMRPWMLGMKEIGFASAVLKSVLLPFEYNNINLKKTSSLCFANKPIHNHLISYFKKFAVAYKSKLRFGFSWLTQICHEFVNYLELGDQDFLDFFKFLNDNGHLDNAFLIFFSDHGSRIDDIRNTFVGRIEERMPLLSIVPPKGFKQRYPAVAQTLEENADKLTSNFDFHQTLVDILNGDFGERLKFRPAAIGRGISLFREIPGERSCADAYIPEHFCACYGSKTISPKDVYVNKASHFAIDHLNKLLNKFSSICAKLTLFKVHEAQIVSLGLSAQGEEESRWTLYKFFSKPEEEKHKRFLVNFETAPGNARFEATVDFHTETGFEVLDEISRTNKYGNTSKCVPEKPLQRYCYCKSQLTNT